MTPAPDNFIALNGKPNYIKTIRKPTCIQLQKTYKKGTALFYTNHKKAGNNSNYFYHGFDDFFSAFVDKLSECQT